MPGRIHGRCPALDEEDREEEVSCDGRVRGRIRDARWKCVRCRQRNAGRREADHQGWRARRNGGSSRRSRIRATGGCAATVRLRLILAVVGAGSVRVRLVQRAGGLDVAARHPCLGRCLPSAAHGEVPGTERQDRRNSREPAENRHMGRMLEDSAAVNAWRPRRPPARSAETTRAPDPRACAGARAWKRGSPPWRTATESCASCLAGRPCGARER